MVDVPTDTPVTIPLPEPTVAVVVKPLVHDPPASASVNAVVKPAQTSAVPVIAEGKGLTVTGVVTKHPVPSE